jgi:hypothetical protein
MDTPEWSCRIKSARRKKRLVKTDRDKRLIQLHKRRAELWRLERLMPVVPLEQPYQRGWKRFFVLRDDVKRGPRAAFFEALLTKINTVTYHPDKSFKQKKRRKKRYGFYFRQQLLREFDPYSWQLNRMKLTDDEKACFTRVEKYDHQNRRWAIKYMVTEPWRFVLKIAPHIIAHIKPVDADRAREIAYIDNHVTNFFLEPRISLLTRGRSYSSDKLFTANAKYINQLKNLPRYSDKVAYLDLET